MILNNLSYDLYATILCQSRVDVNNVVDGQEVPDIYARIQLLAPALVTSVKDYARTGDRRQGGGYKRLVFADDPAQTPFTRQLISVERRRLEQLGLWQPAVPDLVALPPYSIFLQFHFTLISPYLSRDDEVFHINDNPVRKDKVFKVPMVAGSAWKGNLRWTAVHLMVLKWQQHRNATTFAEERFRLAQLFGDEKGEEGAQVRDLAEYLDKQSPQAAGLYRQKVRHYFSTTGNTLPHHSGCLRFYPTFFDRISLEVINPHERETGTGKQPIYFESVPAGASGVFSLLYVPFGSVTEDEVRANLTLMADAICEMMRTYGFSAKKSSGFGGARDDVTRGKIVTATGQWPLTKLSSLKDEVSHVQWS